jgi:fructosamine-3-kinase
LSERPPADLVDALAALGLARDESEIETAERLAGGVSSDIWKLFSREKTFCLKRALPRLRVAAVWEAPVERNRMERLWCETANAVRPGVAPKILAHDDIRHVFAMAYLPPATHRLWKNDLAEAHVEPDVAERVGAAIGDIHRATAGRADLAKRFDTLAFFERLRIDPYLREVARRHADLAGPIGAMADALAGRRIALVHGDLSPKNILIGPGGPVLLDAECAWFGDPAFDCAFCLNHLMLKSVWRPDALAGLIESARAFWGAYYATRIDWEEPAVLEARVAQLLGALLLARIDGKSPVEYIVEDANKDSVRRVARNLILTPRARVADVLAAWEAERRR